MPALTRLDFVDPLDEDGDPGHQRTMTLDGVDADAAIAVTSSPGTQGAPTFDRPAYLRSPLGEGPSVVDDLPVGRIAILCCSACEDPCCGFHAADLVITDDRVVWRGLRFVWPAGMWTITRRRRGGRLRRLLGREGLPEPGPGPEELEPWASLGADHVLEFAFDRTEYEATIRSELARAAEE
jgi:hypothetical protein